jgi:protoporphyrinogen oxidase (EC 1.3.3.4)
LDPFVDLLVLHSSRFGHTTRIAQRVTDRLEEAGHSAELQELGRGTRVDPARHQGVVVGASVRYGYFSRALWRFAARNAEVLSAMPSAFFGVNLVATKPGKDQVDTNAYTRKFLERTPWEPTVSEVFAGELDYPTYNPVDRRLIQLIMSRTGKPTDPSVHEVYTDWDRVDRFAQEFDEALA